MYHKWKQGFSSFLIFLFILVALLILLSLLYLTSNPVAEAKEPITLQEFLEPNKEKALDFSVPEEELPANNKFGTKGIYFAHFSKTGGTTFKAILKQYLDTLNLTWCANKIEQRSNTLPGPWDICGSHERLDSAIPGFTDASFLKVPHRSRNFSSVLMLRDPIDRLLSEYAWFYRYQGHKGAPKGTIDPFFKFQDLAPLVKESLVADVTEDLFQQLDSHSSSTICGFLGKEPKQSDGIECTKKVYDNAISMLLYYDLVLLTEKFDESVVLFSYVFGLPHALEELDSDGSLHYVKRKVISKNIRQSDFPEATLAQLREKLKYDYRLYSLAKRMFYERLELAKTEHPSFSEVLDKYQKKQSEVAGDCLQDDTANFQTCL